MPAVASRFPPAARRWRSLRDTVSRRWPALVGGNFREAYSSYRTWKSIATFEVRWGHARRQPVAVAKELPASGK